MKRKATLFILFLFVMQIARSQTAYLENSAGNCISLNFLGSSTEPGDWYKDASPNEDARIKVCDIFTTQVAGAYAMRKKTGEWSYVIITRDTTHNSVFSPLSSVGGNCYATSAQDLSFSIFSYQTSPPIYVAAFPGKIYAYTGSEFIPISTTCGYLTGSYSSSEIRYDETTGNVHIGRVSITFKSGVTKYADDPTFGVQDDPSKNNNRRFLIGVCNSSSGEDCEDVQIVFQPSQISGGIDLSTGVVSPPDTSTPIHKYVLINSLGVGPNGGKFCIGPNLKVSITQLTPDPVYYNQTLTISYRVSNPRDTPYEIKGGNVKVTTNFDVHITIFNASNPSQVVYETTQTITEDIPPNGYVDKTIYWRAAVHSGKYRVKIEVDYGGKIGECVESDNSAEKEFEVKPVIIPEIWINGVKTNVFAHAGMPHNFTLYLKNSDNETVSWADVRITEENGISLFAPTQFRNCTNLTGHAITCGVRSVNEVRFRTDKNGTAYLTLIPTGNILYAPEYSYLNVSEVVGNYSIYLWGYTSEGEPLIFVINEKITDTYPLSVANYYRYTFSSEYKDLPNLEHFVKAIMDQVYKIFALFWRLMTE